jgi:methyl-accepting chemotaxis protein
LRYLKEISEGNFSQTLDGGGGEEIYQIISNANQIVISLSSLVEKIYDSAIKVYATAEGFLSTSAKLSNITQKLSSEIAQIVFVMSAHLFPALLVSLKELLLHTIYF